MAHRLANQDVISQLPLWHSAIFKSHKHLTYYCPLLTKNGVIRVGDLFDSHKRPRPELLIGPTWCDKLKVVERLSSWAGNRCPVHGALWTFQPALSMCRFHAVIYNLWECRARSAHTVRSFGCRQILGPYFWPLLTSFWFHTGVFFSSLDIWDVAHLNCHPFLPIFNQFYPFSIPHIELSPLTVLCLQLNLPVLLRKLGQSFLRSVLQL